MTEYPDYESESSLIRDILSGNREVFAVFVRRYQNRVYSLGLRFFRNADDASDFAQEVFVKAFERLHTFRGEARFSTWLMKIAYYHGITIQRSKKDWESLPEDFEIPDTGETPEQLHARAAAAQAIKDAVKLLPERFRICVDLYFSFGMTYEDVALATDIPVGTVKSHVFRAKQALRAALKNSPAEDHNGL